MQIKAAVVHEAGAPYSIEDVELSAPGPDQILVKLDAVGMCGTDEAGRAGHLPFEFPVVLGHEGAGTVVETGDAVTEFAPGDKVCLTFGTCGCCEPCKSGLPYACESMAPINFFGAHANSTHPLTQNGEELSSFFSQSSFADYAIVSERSAVKLPEGIETKLAAPFGCGVQTGAGIVLNSLQPTFGSSIVIAGCGTVGLCAVMAARMRGCGTIIAIGGNPDTLELAQELGATHVINRRETEGVLDAIREITGGGADYAVDTTGNNDIVAALLEGLTYTGHIAIAGGGFSLELNTFNLGAKTIHGVNEGHSNPKVFIPQLLEAYKRGDFPIDKLIGYYPFEDINEAMGRSKQDGRIKVVLTL